MKTTLALIAFASLLTAQVEAEQVEAEQVEAEQVAGEDAVTLAYAAKETSLDQGDKAKLQQFARSLQGDAAVEQVAIAAWSDKPLPAGRGAALPKPDLNIAAERGRKVQLALSAQGISTSHVYNMAQRPGSAAEILHTDNAIFKGQDASPKGAEQMAIAAVGKELVAHGKPGTTVVVALRVPPKEAAKSK